MNLPVSFNVLAIDEPGAPVSLQRRTIATLEEDEVLVRVAYASVNKMDAGLAVRNLFRLPTPYVLGFDFSGEVVGLGGRADGSPKVGDQVFGSSKVGAGGCFAEYLVTSRESVFARGAVPAPEASTYGIAYLTAYESLVITGDIQRHAGTWIYVAGAGGGLGHFAAQIARLHGLKVIGSAGKAASLDLLRRLGLAHVIDYTRQDVVDEIMRVTGGRGANVVFDPTYTQSSYDVSTAVVASGGEYIRLGTPEQLAHAGVKDMTALVESRGARMVIGDLGRYAHDPRYQAQMPRVADGMRQAVTWYEEGKLKPRITETVPFDAAALQRTLEAFRAGTNNVGKIVVRCGG